MTAPTLWPGQRPGEHDHKPYDNCPEDCPGRLTAGSPYTVRSYTVGGTAPKVEWDDVAAAVVRRIWALTPDEHQRCGHMDITFNVTMQDLIEAIDDGLNDLDSWCHSCKGPCRDES